LPNSLYKHMLGENIIDRRQQSPFSETSINSTQ